MGSVESVCMNIRFGVGSVGAMGATVVAQQGTSWKCSTPLGHCGVPKVMRTWIGHSSLTEAVHHVVQLRAAPEDRCTLLEASCTHTHIHTHRHTQTHTHTHAL